MDMNVEKYSEKELCCLITEDPRILARISDEFKTRNVCSTAIRQNGYMIQYVPEHIISYDMCVDAVVSTPMSIFNIKYSYLAEDTDPDSEGEKIAELIRKYIDLAKIALANETNEYNKRKIEYMIDEHYVSSIGFIFRQ